MIKVKQVILVRKDLNMSSGKVGSQVAHAAMLFILNKIKHNLPYTRNELIWMFENPPNGNNDWTWGGMKKIVLGVENLKELLELTSFSLTCGLETHICQDETLGEITAVAIGPDFEEEIDKITNHLKLLGKD